ncbi:MAG: hypothetical protein WEA58_11445 [Balneolaceae bacterium]
MAYRKIHDSFWTDPDMEELTPEQKLFYIYLITNPYVNQIGLYELSIKRACFETGYNIDTVSKLLEYFEDTGKIRRSEETKEIVVIKLFHHNKSNSPKVKKHVEGLLSEVKDTSLIQYVYGFKEYGYCIQTASQEEEEKEEEKEEKPSNIAEEIYELYPRKVGKAEALKKIKKALKKVDADVLSEKVQLFAESVEGQESQFIPYPATWFNQCRWEDDPAEWKAWKDQKSGGKPTEPIPQYLNRRFE